jgi:aerobic carbon-monoxide dehydrogenase large subunit
VLSERSFKAVGKALPRNEDRRLVTGRGRFSDDFALPGQVWAAMVRSPHPHAWIAAIDTAEAMAMPGVLGVYTGADVQTDGLKPIPHNPVPSTNFDVKLTGRHPTRGPGARDELCPGHGGSSWRALRKCEDHLG